MNPELGIPILDALWTHFSDFYVADKEVLPPLQFNNIHMIRDPDVILKVELQNHFYCSFNWKEEFLGASRQLNLRGWFNYGQSC